MRIVVVVLLWSVGVSAMAAAAQDDTRYRWDLRDLYPTPEAFEAARRGLTGRLGELEAGRGRLGESGAELAAVLDRMFGFMRELARVASYASMRSDEDTRAAEPQAVRQEVQQLAVEFQARTAWIAPEILALPEGRVGALLRSESRLAPYRFFLENLERQRPHTLSPPEEKLLAQAGTLARAPYNLYGILANADLPFPQVTLSSGETVRLDQAGYTRYRSLPERADRILVFSEFWKTFKQFERSFGVALDAQLNAQVFAARARRYPSALAASLAANNVPEGVYRRLIAEAHRMLPLLHRAFRLRASVLGIEHLAYHDVYPPLVKERDLHFPIEKGQELVLQSLWPLGEEYTAVVAKGFSSRWMDVYPRTGKRSGAYSNGSAYDVHPYVLMNYNDDYESVSTLTHEWGHAMHSYLANAAQPYPTAEYSIFVAEVASTFNEVLLLDHMLRQAKGNDERLYYLGSYLEGLRGTFFRQAMFAEFELAIHEAVERGEALTGERLSAMYLELLRRYHGHEQGVVQIDPAYAVEWAYIPHFYYNFYVYQYATSLAAATQLAQRVLAGETGARERYLALLKAGGSRYPYELLVDAGIDLASEAPYRALELRLTWVLDEVETIIAQQRGR